MNKSQIIDAVVKETGLKKKEAEAAVNSVFTTIESALLQGEKVTILENKSGWYRINSGWVSANYIKIGG